MNTNSITLRFKFFYSLHLCFSRRKIVSYLKTFHVLLNFHELMWRRSMAWISHLGIHQVSHNLLTKIPGNSGDNPTLSYICPNPSINIGYDISSANHMREEYFIKPIKSPVGQPPQIHPHNFRRAVFVLELALRPTRTREQEKQRWKSGRELSVIKFISRMN